MKNEDHSLGNFDLFETEEIKCEKQNSEIEFSKRLNCKYFFNKRQIIYISIKKGISIDSTIIYKIYHRITIFSSLIASQNSIYERSLKEKDPESEKIIIKIAKSLKNNSISDELSLFDYFKSGIKLSCYISLDFSKGYNPYIIEEKNNYFESILKSITFIILNYTLKHSIFLYGIGGKLNIEDNFNQVFNINKNEIDASINSIDKILGSYNNCLKEITSDYKIYLSPLINKVNNEINNLHEVKNYNILFILLKENIYYDDIKNTIDFIIESSYLPLTIIIIGVGNTNFEEMNTAFNSIPNIASNGIKKYRNNVLFISLKKYENNVENFIESCLKETVKHMIKFYDLIKCTPSQIKKGNFENVNNSFNLYNNSINISKNDYISKFEKPNPELIFKKLDENIDEYTYNSNSQKETINNKIINESSYDKKDKKKERKINNPIESFSKNNNEDNINDEESINTNINNNNENNIKEEENIINKNIKNNIEDNINDEKENNNYIKIIPSNSIYEENQTNPYFKNLQNNNINNNIINKFTITNSSSTSIIDDNKKNYNPYSFGNIKTLSEGEEIKSTYNSENYKDSNNS